MSKHIMVDLETLGQSPGCSILSIGAVVFDPYNRTLGGEFYRVVNRASCNAAGLSEDASTLAWWQRQNAKAREVIAEAETAPLGIAEAIEEFSAYVRGFGGGDVRIWGNGSDFDNAILAVCYERTGQKMPWRFWNNRCFRTLKSLSPKGKEAPRQGVYHNALDDAKTQAYAAIAYLQRYRALAE